VIPCSFLRAWILTQCITLNFGCTHIRIQGVDWEGWFAGSGLTSFHAFVFYSSTLSKRKIKQLQWQIDDWWNGTEVGELKCLEEHLSATFRTKNTIWTGLVSNLVLHGETPWRPRLPDPWLNCLWLFVASFTRIPR